MNITVTCWRATSKDPFIFCAKTELAGRQFESGFAHKHATPEAAIRHIEGLVSVFLNDLQTETLNRTTTITLPLEALAQLKG